MAANTKWQLYPVYRYFAHFFEIILTDKVQASTNDLHKNGLTEGNVFMFLFKDFLLVSFISKGEISNQVYYYIFACFLVQY